MATDRPDILDLPARDPDDVVRYAERSDGVIDIYSLRHDRDHHGTPPVVVLIHGGFWRAAYDRTHLRPLAAALAARGATVALPEFRRVGAGGEWPTIGDDVEAALAAIKAHMAASGPPGAATESPSTTKAPRTAGAPSSVRPLVVAGHSAGGHLAMWAGLRAEPTRVSRIVALAPVSDVYAAASARLGNGATQALLGGGPTDVPERYAQADPSSYLPGDVPITIIQGDQDDAVPVGLNRNVAARYPAIEYRELSGVGHMDLVDPRERACLDHVIPALIGTSPTLR